MSQSPLSPATSVYSSTLSGHTVSSTSSPRITVPTVVEPPPFDYALTIRQQPEAARACGNGERDRRCIDPPPIIELKITNRATGLPEPDSKAMLALHCTLMNEKGDEDAMDMPPDQLDGRCVSRLMGTLVASPYQAKDDRDVPSTFFVFPDISCRHPGRYRLRFRLLRVDPSNVRPGTSSRCVADVLTGPISVFTPKEFPGMKESSSLLKTLRRQGLNVGVKKGSEARKSKSKVKKQPSDSDEDEDDDGDEVSLLASSQLGSPLRTQARQNKRKRIAL